MKANLTVDGYIASTLNITKGIQIISGGATWEIHVDDCTSSNPQLLIGNESGAFVKIGNSNMYLNGNILYTNNLQQNTGSNYNNIFEGSVLVEGNHKVDGNIIVNTLYVTNTSNYWSEYVDDNMNLIFKSKMGSLVEFSELFKPEVLNFTGKHRCKNGSKVKPSVGMIVYSTGKYADLDDIAQVTIDEALPIVKLTKRKMDARAFGVIGGYDEEGRFQIGNISFLRPQMTPRLIVQSQGEGAIWVCSMGGPIQNGDYITTSSIPGYGMKQRSKMYYNYTVAKVTENVKFTKRKKIFNKGKIYYVAFVGCTYCF